MDTARGRRPQLFLCDVGFLCSWAVVGSASCQGADLSLAAVLKPSRDGQVTSFASYLDVDGDRLLVGAAQGAFLYRHEGSVRDWSQQEFVASPNWGMGASFGSTVALEGGAALLGARDMGFVTPGQQSGAAYLFEKPVGLSSYTHTQTFLPTDAESFDQFGSSLELGDGIAFVGANNDSHHAKQNTGTVTLFRRNSETERFEEVKKFAPLDLVPGHGFGNVMDLDGDRLVVGIAGGQHGAAYIYEKDTGGPDNWGQAVKLGGGQGSGGRLRLFHSRAS